MHAGTYYAHLVCDCGVAKEVAQCHITSDFLHVD